MVSASTRQHKNKHHVFPVAIRACYASVWTELWTSRTQPSAWLNYNPQMCLEIFAAVKLYSVFCVLSTCGLVDHQGWLDVSTKRYLPCKPAPRYNKADQHRKTPSYLGDVRELLSMTSMRVLNLHFQPLLPISTAQ